MVKVIPSHEGFTLVEILIVGIIVAILVSIAMPAYIKALEQAQGAKAMQNLQRIQTAQALYRTDSTHYTDDITLLKPFIDFSEDDGDWTYTIESPAGTSFTARAERSSGKYSGASIELDQNAKITYSSGHRYPP